MTLPRHAGQIPIYHDHKPTGRPLNEYHRHNREEFGGFTQRLLDCNGAPRYRFGYGLSYTNFSLSPAAVTQVGSAVTVTVSVRNTGSRSGSTVVQVYVRPAVAETSQPVRRLIGYQRVHSSAGVTQEVIITIPLARLAYCHRDGQRRVDSGRYAFFVGQDASDGSAVDVMIAVADG